jgi:hypothetical protein
MGKECLSRIVSANVVTYSVEDVPELHFGRSGALASLVDLP